MATKNIEIKPLQMEEVRVKIVGDTSLIVHAFSEKAKRMMLDAQRGKKTTKKHEIKIPMNDFMDSLHWLTEKPEHGEDDEEAERNFYEAIQNGARFGAPLSGIKASIITGAYRAGLDVKMTELRGVFFVYGDTEHSTGELAEIIAPAPEMREDMVRVGGISKSADIRYRAEFHKWEIPLRIKYHKDGKYSLEEILNLINYGGAYSGICEWRPEKNGGQHGMYHLETV